jgi:hypothetical protein
MYIHVSVGLALAAGIVFLGSTDASARGRPKVPKADYTSNVAPSVKSRPSASANRNAAARAAVAALAPFRYQGGWKNSRL